MMRPRARQTTSPFWFTISWPIWTIPRSGFVFDARFDTTRRSRRRRSPGRVGSRSSRPSFPSPASTAKSGSTVSASRHWIAKRCAELAVSPPKIESRAAASSRWKGCGSQRRANSTISSRSSSKISALHASSPTARSSRYARATRAVIAQAWPGTPRRRTLPAASQPRRAPHEVRPRHRSAHGPEPRDSPRRRGGEVGLRRPPGRRQPLLPEALGFEVPLLRDRPLLPREHSLHRARGAALGDGDRDAPPRGLPVGAEAHEPPPGPHREALLLARGDVEQPRAPRRRHHALEGGPDLPGDPLGGPRAAHGRVHRDHPRAHEGRLLRLRGGVLPL